MDKPESPWRTLEEQPALPGSPAASSDAGRRSGAPGLARGPWLAVAFTAAAVIAGVAVWIILAGGHGTVVVEGGRPAPGSSGRADSIAGAVATPSGDTLVVDVQGAVVRPGIVRLPAGARVADAVAAAGGFGPRVAADRVGQSLNLAALVKDGDQVVVPSRDNPAVSPAPGAGGNGAGTGTSGGGGPVDLNRATAAELDALPGIGPVTAAKIIAARSEQAFASVDDLRSRKILGAAVFDKVKDLVMVR